MLNSNIWLPEDVDAIMEKYGVVCVTRLTAPESDRGGAIREEVTSGMPEKWTKNIHVIQDWVINDISATSIRKQLANGCSVKYIVPDPVIKIIHEDGLYGWKRSASLSDWPTNR
jgi:nicotinic acid mononucleotide adenylyltransferase